MKCWRAPLLVAAVAAAVAVAQTCDGGDRCSGHGTCRQLQSRHTTRHSCLCMDGWYGSDCSKQPCPTGKVWNGPASNTDTLHDREAECSGVGTCDDATGTCKCQSFYHGNACQYFKCPGGTETPCSGNGRCISMREAGEEYDGVQFVNRASYSQWDADMMFGCACEPGFEGYDCSKRSCPKAADPVAVAADGLVGETQEVVCTCTGTCSGFISVELQGKMSQPIAYNAVAAIADETASSTATGTGRGESVEAKLEGMNAADTIASVTMSSGVLCDAAGATTTISFRSSLGDIEELSVTYEDTLVSDAGAGTATVTVSTTTDATTTPVECSDRGVCNGGLCTCYDGYAASDGDSGSGLIADCGYEDTPTTSCPNDCSGTGFCSGAPYYTCSCYAGFEGPDCSRRACPTGTAWFDEPTATDVAHAEVVCSNKGFCQASGDCVCQDGFTGPACNWQKCPVDSAGKTCGGRGMCLTNREFADVGRFGGELAQDGRNEVQTLTCTLAAGSFRLAFRYSMTGSISYDATLLTLRDTLDALPSLSLVEVSFSSGSTVCDAGGLNTVRITFPYDRGDLPLLSSDTPASVTIAEETPGSRIVYGSVPGQVSTWDADMLRSCHCDSYPNYNTTDTTLGDGGKWTGGACNLRTCPRGTDPWAGEPLRYAVACVGDGGTLDVSFGAEAITTLDVTTATVSTLQTQLSSLSTVTTVAVDDNVGSTLLCAAPAATTFNFWINTELRPQDLDSVGRLVFDASSMTASSGTVGVTSTLVSDTIGNENQTIACTADGGSFVLRFRGQSTSAIAYNADESDLQIALESLPSIGVVSVTTSGATSPKSVCSATGETSVVFFRTELGDLPLITVEENDLTLTASTPTLTVTETDKGLSQNLECSGRGICDEKTGACLCQATYVSSVDSALGARGDCSAVDQFYYVVDARRALIDQARRNAQTPV